MIIDQYWLTTRTQIRCAVATVSIVTLRANIFWPTLVGGSC